MPSRNAGDTFSQPPHEGVTLASLYAYHATNSQEHPLFIYDDTGTNHTIRYPEAHRAVRRAASLIKSNISDELAAEYTHTLSRTGNPPVIGVLSVSGA